MSTMRADDMRDIANRVFARKETTLEQEAERFELDHLIGTAKAVRRMLRSTVESAPDASFEAQPDDDEGNEVWSAGQVISHLTGVTGGVRNSVREILGKGPVDAPPEMAQYLDNRTLSRQASLEALDLMDAQLGAMLDEIPDDAGPGVTIAHPRFGDMGVRGWILMTAIHESNHINQINELSSES